MENESESTPRMEAERLLTTASKLLTNRDFTSSKDFAILAQETDPLLEGSDQIVAVSEVLLAAEKRINNHPDWYSVLQLAPRTADLELIKKQYRRLALLLHPDKNKFPFADSAFRLVADSWGVLSDPVKKSALDVELGAYFSRVDLQESRKQKEKDIQRMHQQQINKARQQNQNSSGVKLPVRRNTSGAEKRGRPKKSPVSGGAGGGGVGIGGGGAAAVGVPNFWTACPYCYHLYEYPRRYNGCCLICQNCEKTFTADPVVAVPQTVAGREEYYCCWGMFPMGFSDDKLGKGKGGPKGFTNWMPPMQSGADAVGGGVDAGVGVSMGEGAGGGDKQIPTATPGSGKKRGRPRKVV